MKDNISDLEKVVKDFCEERDWDQFHNPKDLSIGISTEANELLEIFRFKSKEEIEYIMNNTNKKEKVENELADIMFFILRFAQMNNIDLENILKRKIKINSQKYPIDLAKGNNKKYNEL
ncbi:nucleotide pyrophosphohydrolase [Halanaerobium sp. ST460_2HS_T2]|uniref:nucleotide pyrophosphohydrolase n=1 Tax=Halanaerobium sp. ST460_2HS_T2 TaxID=2183914 RepID=UPI000DF4AB0D|nr:nucleotide pyrophosphohydrolase [Halanaerobium sp. ST460_2HS_T2]RCW57323.1 NTP pyrophosphatase (non-canonical NTP hydrolase) [Halanaerobium sp. ST460_2HS_T2]